MSEPSLRLVHMMTQGNTAQHAPPLTTPLTETISPSPNNMSASITLRVHQTNKGWIDPPANEYLHQSEHSSPFTGHSGSPGALWSQLERICSCVWVIPGEGYHWKKEGEILSHFLPTFLFFAASVFVREASTEFDPRMWYVGRMGAGGALTSDPEKRRMCPHSERQ